MEITDIKIRKTFEDQPLRAILSVVFDNSLALHDVKIIYARDRYFVVMPSKKTADGSFKDVVHPINSSFREELEKNLISEYLSFCDTQKASESFVSR